MESVATFGAGCFWCIDAALAQLEQPTYPQVCSGTTGHAEVVQVRFDPDRISYETLLSWFWKLHDPTTRDRQGNDVGTQYRSVIFYLDDEQRRLAEASLLATQEHHRAPIVTEITAAGTFWVAEDYHHDYYRQNKEQPYCRVVIASKLDKLGLRGD